MATLHAILDEIEELSEGDDSICVVVDSSLLKTYAEYSLSNFRKACNTVWKDKLNTNIGPIAYHVDEPQSILSVNDEYGNSIIHVPVEITINFIHKND